VPGCCGNGGRSRKANYGVADVQAKKVGLQ